MRVNLAGIVVAIMLPFAGYCFWGQTGAGIGVVLVILIQLVIA